MKEIAVAYQKSSESKALKQTVEEMFQDYSLSLLHSTGSNLLFDLLNGSYDLIQTDEAIRNGAIGAVASRILDIPLVTEIRGWDDYLNSHGLYNFKTRCAIKVLVNISLSQADAVVFVSEKTKAKLEPEYDFDRYRYIKPLFTVDRYYNETDHNWGSDPILTTVTNLRYKEKLEGVKTILQALNKLYPDFNGSYKIAGGGDHLKCLKEYVDNYEYSDRVEVLGYREDIPNILKKYDIYVYMSYLDSLGRTILEAQAAGLPVIAGDTGGIAESVGDYGITCEPTADGIARAIQNLANNPNLQRELSLSGQYRMQKYCELQATKHVELWGNLLSSYPTAVPDNGK